MTSSPIIKKAYADTPYGQIHYRYSIPSAPPKSTPLIFLHKSASSSASYTHLMDHYSSLGHRCYAPDMPGFGSSFDPTPPQILEIESRGTGWYVEVFMSAFKEIGILEGEMKGVHLVGHHSGAVLAVELAATYPSKISSICLIGPTVMNAEERAAMKEIYFKPFNEPVPDGSHLQKTWDYLGNMGIGGDLELWQREAIDHVRAWKGRNLIYGAVWAQDAETLYKRVQCKILLMCARDDVLWKFFGFVKGLREEGVSNVEIKGGNFEPDRDWEGVSESWTEFLEKVDRGGV
ncbi:Alpha/Beta hydrolase protein [Tricladium varicosporioides]|nr:Alpha/Beta hydrolase protein [Hymenoscyphus varicosporioides]